MGGGHSAEHVEKTYAGGALVFGLTLIGIVVFFVDLGITKWRPQFIAWYSAAAFVFLSFTISMATIWGHLVNYRNPRAQRYVVRIVVLVPLYSVQSWFSLRFHDLGFFFGSLRDCYEAYVIFCFFAWLLAVQGGEERIAIRFNHTPTTKVQHPPPVSWVFKPWAMGRSVGVSAEHASSGHSSAGSWLLQIAVTGLFGRSVVVVPSPFLLHCQAGVLQYVVLKLCLTFVSFGLEPFGLFGEGEFTPRKGWLYVSATTNLSQMWAMYCLIRFYTVCASELRPFHPLGKLLAVKAVVFFTYSQSCAIALVLWMDLLPSAIEENGDHWSSEDVGRGLQDWLICIEMLLASVVFANVFSHRDYYKDEFSTGLHHHDSESDDDGDGQSQRTHRSLLVALMAAKERGRGGGGGGGGLLQNSASLQLDAPDSPSFESTAMHTHPLLLHKAKDSCASFQALLHQSTSPPDNDEAAPPFACGLSSSPSSASSAAASSSSSALSPTLPSSLSSHLPPPYQIPSSASLSSSAMDDSGGAVVGEVCEQMIESPARRSTLNRSRTASTGRMSGERF